MEGAARDPGLRGRNGRPSGLANPRDPVGSVESVPIGMLIGCVTRRRGRGQRHIRQHMGARDDIIMSFVLRAPRAVRVRALSVMGASKSDARACVNSCPRDDGV
ncbi:hypothetical protein GCM10009748_10820 [Agromyces lapidis]